MRDKTPTVTSLTKQETESQCMSPRPLNQAVEAIQRDGCVVIENAVPHDPLDMRRAKMDRDSEVLIARALWGGAAVSKVTCNRDRLR